MNKYKISSVRVKNFKCFDDSMFYEFNILDDKSPILLSGPNGFGKTSFYDAIELILSNNITRYNKDIERLNANLKGNILLNDKTKDGYIVMCLVSNSNDSIREGFANRKILTIGAKISKNIKNIDITGTIEYKWISEEIKTEELDRWLYDDENKWYENLSPEILSYNKDNFNLLYYISQAESAHFLNNPLNKRKEEIDTLLDINWAINRRDFISKLINNGNNHILYKLRNNLKIKLESEIENYRKIKEKVNEYDFGDVEYKSLGLLYKDKDFFSWDTQAIEEKFLDKNIRKLETLIKFLENYDSYKIFSHNKDIESINQDDIEKYLRICGFIKNGKIQEERIEKHIEHYNKIIQEYDRSKFIREPINLDLYNKNDIEFLKGFLKDFDDNSCNNIIQLVEDIKGYKKNLRSDEKAITKIDEARRNLKYISDEYLPHDNNRCPYCNTEFESHEDLNRKFTEVESILKVSMTDKQRVIRDRYERLKVLIEPVKTALNEYFGVLGESEIAYRKESKYFLKSILNDQGSMKKIEKISYYLGDEFEHINKSIIDVEDALSNKKLKIEDDKFTQLNNEYNFENYYRKNKIYIDNIKEEIILDDLYNKQRYLEKLSSEYKNHELLDSKEKIRNMIEEDMKYIEIGKKLGEIKNIYDDVIESFKKDIIKNISIPLLIYTGKLLQEYQSGLGVFIDEGEFRFISDGSAKHDILNTFSSGQTSACVISFMLAMNKLYVGDDDQLGFLLIDDPVQTMDDINMASLVELLRNEFDDKQIILSTHEIEKENYILYKFLKYGKIGQSFNVKDELYSY